MDTLLRPNSIAVVGVSENPDKLGSVIFKNILDAGFEGQVYPVNPKYKDVFRQQCFPSVKTIKKEIDLVVIVIPAEFVPDVAKDCAEAKVKNMVVISAGFSETGEEGLKLQNEVLEIAQKAGTRVLGPNCLGIIAPAANLNASFSTQAAKPGDIAFVSQSGAFNTAMLDMAAESGLGFYDFVSLGNKADLNELDFFKTWLKDPNVKVIGAYLEEIEDGKDLVDLVEENPGKPVVILNPGKSTKAQEAIQSHTGSLASPARVIKAAFKQSGIIQVDTIEQLYATLLMFSWSKPPKGNKVGLITNAGGLGIVLTDMLENAGLELPAPSAGTKVQLQNFLPEAASVRNPIDLVGDALADRYIKAIELVAKDAGIDSIMVLLTPQYITQIEETANAIIAAQATTEKPIIPVFVGGLHVQKGIELMLQKKIPAFKAPEEAVYAFKALTEYSSHKPSLKIRQQNEKAKHKKELAKYLKKEAVSIPQELVQELAEEFKLVLPKEKVIKRYTEAVAFASQNGYPVVLKATAEDVLHKTDLKALFLDLKSEGDLLGAYEELRKNIAKSVKNKNPNLLIQEFIPQGEELIIGVQRDGGADVYEKTGKGFGHTILFGKGGIYTEVYQDTGLSLVPIGRDEILKLVQSTKVSEIIKGIRGRKELALDKLVETIEHLQKMIFTYPEIYSIDMNPVKLDEKRCVVLDFKVIIKI